MISKKRKMMMVVVVLLLVGLSVSGIWLWKKTSDWGTTNGGGGLPGPQPRIVIDSQDNFSVVWLYLNETLSYEAHYMKLNNNGEILIPEKNIAKHISIPRFYMMIDSCDKIHIVFYNISGEAWKYMRIDNNGNILVNLTNMSDISVIPPYPIIQSDGGKLIYVGENGAVDANDNIHIVESVRDQHTGNYTLYYRKFVPNGTMIINTTNLPNLGSHDSGFGRRVLIDSLNNLNIFWHSYVKFTTLNDYDYHIYYIKLDTNGTTLINITEIPIVTPTIIGPTLNSIVIDDNDIFHLGIQNDIKNIPGSKVFYMKTNTAGNVLFSDKKVSDLPAEGGSVAVDSNGYVYIVFSTSYHGYPIYYVKLDSNGNNLTGDIKLVDTRDS